MRGMTLLSVPMTPAVTSAKVATRATVMTPSVTAYSAMVWPLSGPEPAPNSFMGTPFRYQNRTVGYHSMTPLVGVFDHTLGSPHGARRADLHVRGRAGMARRPPRRGDLGRPAGARGDAAAGVSLRRRGELEPRAPVPGVDPVVH